MQPGANILGCIGVATALVARDQYPARHHTGDTGQSYPLPYPTHGRICGCTARKRRLSVPGHGTSQVAVVTKADPVDIGGGPWPGFVSRVREAADEMARHTTFKFCLYPTVEQQKVLARHAGAARFGFNQCLRMVKTGLTQRRIDRAVKVPWTGFDLINTFNAWKKGEAAGRVFVVDPDGMSEIVVTSLTWRGQVYQQVFEEAAVDCGRAAGRVVTLAQR